ncbi:diguanylate cyclase [Agarivorans sp. TSD2052]|uniref:TackOD1 domain-containing metal-binding protein n=1 Tax=Agarivorans sp. TSD2052 TaxID=2937286 RepID=UPI00200DD882|nr:diguanylate cyclase [Agarivorans sp. TSD2052]UPW19360.1 diguanylate cyclase [Agarivorans sp. TSD2052]
MKINLLGKPNPPLSSQHYEFDSIEQLLAALEINQCVHLNLDEPQLSQTLMILRADAVGALVLAFIPQGSSALSQKISDGFVDDLQQNQLQQQYLERLAKLHSDTLTSPHSRLISYLWLLPSRLLKPNYQTEQWHFHYPLLDCWQEQAEQAWLNSLEKEQVIAKAQLIDRVRQCRSCSSSTLNYVETCPSCHSIDIDNFTALHCFACGHVDQQEAFQQSHSLVCPNCHSQLRHIGVDYDRPIENHQCHTCGDHFIDGEVKANCLSCGNSNKLDELKEQRWYNYQLAERGELWAQSGKQVSLLPDSLGEPLSTEHFRWLLQWQNQLALRHSHQHLMLALHFKNLNTLYSELSSTEVFARLDEFFIRFQSLIRQTDVVTRWNNDMLLFFLPHFEESHIEVLEDKLLKLAKIQTNNPLELAVSVKKLPEETLSNHPEQWLQSLVEALRND